MLGGSGILCRTQVLRSAILTRRNGSGYEQISGHARIAGCRRADDGGLQHHTPQGATSSDANDMPEQRADARPSARPVSYWGPQEAAHGIGSAGERHEYE